jgi:hypothetical protein
MPTSYWEEAVTAGAYIINRVPSSSLQFQTPFEVLHCIVNAPTMPNLSPKVFGCVAFVHLHKGWRTKLEPRALRCVFVGYALHQKGYRCYHPPSRKLYVTLDVVFHETTMYYSAGSTQWEASDKVQTSTNPAESANPADNLDVIVQGNRLDNLETSNEYPGDENIGDHQDREEYTSDASYGSDGPKIEIIDSNEDNLEVPTVSHNVPVNQLSSPVDSILESHESPPSEPLKELPNRVTRGKPKVNYEPVLHFKVKYPMNNYVSYHRLS